MSTTVFRRPLRRPGPELPSGELALQEPPALPESQSPGIGNLLYLLPMLAGGAAMSLFFVGGGGGALGYLGGGLMGISMLGMSVGQLGRGGGDRKRKLKGERRDYLRYLTQLRKQTRKIAVQQRESLTWAHPSPAGLWSVAMSNRLWERRPAHDDFVEVRLGTGEQRLGVRLRPPQTKPVEDLEPLCASALRRFIRAYSTVPALPVAVYLRSFSRLLLTGDPATGDRDAARGMVRAMVAQLVTFHCTDDLRVAVCASEERRADWEWAKWLPHALHPTESDAAGPVRLVAETYPDLERLLGEAFTERPRFEPGAAPTKEEPYTVILLDGVKVPPMARIAETGYRNTIVVDLGEAIRPKPDKTMLRLKVTSEQLESVGSDRTGKDTFTALGRPDRLSAARCRKLAHLLAAYRMGGSIESSEPLATDFELTTLLGIGDVRTFRPAALWNARAQYDRLRVPIGIAADGSPLELDLKESAQGGMGPHGMLIGATGSGKSELLRTLVLALAMTHSPEVLNFILTDFKGGATFIGMERLPHTSAVITNLADELPLVDRMQDALHGEMVRRQETLRRAGYASLRDYEQARLAGVSLDPLPTLLVVVDEFSELLSAKRDFMDLFIMIGRLGRSLGVHLLLASQRLDEGRVHALESHLSYRIGLKTFSVSESRAVLGVPDAFTLPANPGNGYLRFDTTSLVRFKAAYVSGAVKSTERRRPQAVLQQQVVPYVSGYLAPRTPPVVEEEAEAEPPPTGTEQTLMGVIVDRLRDQGPPARQVWLPPLAEPATLDQIVLPLAEDPELGLAPLDWPGRGGLMVPVGLVDRPFEGVRDLLVANLTGAAGHVGIVGAPQTGKSTMVRTLIAGLALTHTPREVQVYCLDFGGGTLAGVAGLPHVGGVSNRLERDKVTRTLAEMVGVLNRRERIFSQRGIDSMSSYRRLLRAGRVPEDPYGDVFLVVDGWFTMRQEFDALESFISDLANRGLSYGVHLVITASRWSEIRPWLRDLLGTRFELRLGDAIDSEVGSRAAANVPPIPGRGLTSEAQHFLSALPRIDGSPNSEDVADATRELVQTVAGAWSGPPAPPVRLLPSTLDVAELPPADGDLRVPIGWGEQDLDTVWHDFEQNAHLMVFGDAETGKTNLLRLVARSVAASYGPGEARVILADPRRDLFDAVPQDMQLGFAVSASALSDMVKEAAGSLAERLPGPDVTPEQLKARDWWAGPRLFLLIDDYDLLASSGNCPIQALEDLLPQAADIGLHVVVARSTSSASRGMMDRALRRMQEIGTPALLLSCPRDEGQFLGDTKPLTLPTGRAQLVQRRRRPTLVQTALVAAAEEDSMPEVA
jgi:DNA segregation ATPase FtsK/SpoIIIE, S-DNA-T family